MPVVEVFSRNENGHHRFTELAVLGRLRTLFCTRLNQIDNALPVVCLIFKFSTSQRLFGFDHFVHLRFSVQHDLAVKDVIDTVQWCGLWS